MRDDDDMKITQVSFLAHIVGYIIITSASMFTVTKYKWRQAQQTSPRVPLKHKEQKLWTDVMCLRVLRVSPRRQHKIHRGVKFFQWGY